MADCGSRGLRREVTFVVQVDKPVGLDGVEVVSTTRRSSVTLG